MQMIEIVEYIDARGISPYGRWRDNLDPAVSARVLLTTYRLASGNFSTVKGVAEGVLELRMDFGPGYRVYFAKDGEAVILLLGGGTKRRQHKDIEAAKTLWQEYRRKKSKEG